MREGRTPQASVSRRAVDTPRSGIRVIYDMVRGSQDVISFAIGEPDFGTPKHIREAAKSAIEEGYTRYTPNAGFDDLREAIKEKLRRENDIDIETNEIVVTPGGQGALTLAMMATIDPGDEVLVPDPGYASYKAQVIMCGGRPISVPVHEKDDFRMIADSITNLITSRTKMIVFCNPSNPTGALLDENDIRALAKIATDNDLLIVSDEAYEKFLYGGARHFSIGALPEARTNTISVFSFSKAYGMTGWRVGYAVADQAIVAQMTKLQEHVSAHPSSISQKAALAAYRGPQDHIASVIAEYTARRNAMVSGLNRIAGVSCVQPRGAFYTFANFKSFGKPSLQIATDLIKKARVATVPGTAFGDHGEGYLRFTYACSMKDITDGLTRIEAASKSL